MNLVASSSDAAALLMKMEKTGSNFENNGHENNVVRITISPEMRKSLSSSSMDEKVLVKNYSNFKESGSPGRVMYYSEDGSWVDYSPEVVEVVRRFFELKNALIEVNQRGYRCLLDFCRMLEVEFESGKVRSIAWIDVNGKCFFPNSFTKPSPNVDLEVKVCETVENKANRNGATPAESVNYHVKPSPKIDLEVKVCENKGEFEEIQTNRNGDTPVEIWNHHPEIDLGIGESREEFEEIESNDATNAMWPNTKLLNEETEQTYLQFKNFLQTTIRIAEPEATITRIHKSVKSKPLHKAKVEAFMNESRKNVDPNVVFAWFGTSAKGVESILGHGFDMSNQFRCPQGYGGIGGLFFSPVKFPHHSAVMSEVDNNGERHMILCRIMLGRCRKATDAGSIQRLANSKDFDSAVVESKNAHYYVVWPDKINTHILPEAVISYNPGGTLNGQQVRGNLSGKMVSITGLLSSLKKTLPQAKRNELHALYDSFKAGRIGRDVFARRLRVIAGNERLRSVIREIHG